VTATSRDLTGLIVMLSSMASNLPVDVLSGYISGNQEGGIVVSFFVDCTDSELVIDEVKSYLGGLNFIENASVEVSPMSGVYMNTHTFPLLLGDERAVVLAASHLAEIINYLREGLGEAANTLLYGMGVRYGRSLIKQLRSETGIESAALPKLALDEVQAVGWCIIKEYKEYRGDINVMSWKVTVKDLLECILADRDGSGNRSHFFRGVLSGLIGEALGVMNVSCLETLCSANNARVCEFALWV